MLTTFKQDEWKEPADVDQRIETFKVCNPSVDEVRKLFPFKGIAKRRLLPYGIPEGAVLQYIRVKHEPSLYPFIGMIGVAGETGWGEYPRRLVLDSNEIQVIEA